MISGLDVLWEVCLRTWRITWRRPVLLTFSLGQPLIWMLFFGFLFQRFPISGFSYLDFLAPGVSAMTVLFGASQAGIGWIRDLNTGFLPRMLNTPASPAAILAGKILADVVRLLLQALAVLALALVLGARLRPNPAMLPVGVLCLALFAAAFCSISCAIALHARAQETLATFVHMPGWLAVLAEINPLSIVVEVWRGALLSIPVPGLAGRVLYLVALIVLFFLLALKGMKPASRRY